MYIKVRTKITVPKGNKCWDSRIPGKHFVCPHLSNDDSSFCNIGFKPLPNLEKDPKCAELKEVLSNYDCDKCETTFIETKLDKCPNCGGGTK